MKKSFFFSFLGFVIVLAITTGIILYANGYTLNLDTKKIQKTGVIKVTSTPDNATIYIDNQNKGTSPVSVFNLDPKEYLITVKKTGYTTWSEKVTVVGNKINLIYPILYPSNVKATRIEDNANIDTLYFGKDIYAYTQKNKQGGDDLYVHFFGSGFLDIGDHTQLITNTQSLGIDTSYVLDTVSFSPSKNNMILTLHAKNLPPKYLLLATDGSTSPIDLDTLTDMSMYNGFSWADDNHILLMNSSLLISLDITNGQKILLHQNTSSGSLMSYAYSNNAIYYITQKADKSSYALESIQLDGTNAKILDTQTSPLTSLITTDNGYAYNIMHKQLIISSPQLSNTPLLIKEDANTDYAPVAFSPDGKFLLYQDQTNNLYTYSIETNQSYNLNLDRNAIQNIYWDKSSRILIYTTKADQYYSINGINYDGSNNDIIFTGTIPSSSLLISPSTSNILFEMANLSLVPGQQDKGIYQISINGL